MVIELKRSASFCIPYSRVVIAVEGRDYDAFVKMMDHKYSDESFFFFGRKAWLIQELKGKTLAVVVRE